MFEREPIVWAYLHNWRDCFTDSWDTSWSSKAGAWDQPAAGEGIRFPIENTWNHLNIHVARTMINHLFLTTHLGLVYTNYGDWGLGLWVMYCYTRMNTPGIPRQFRHILWPPKSPVRAVWPSADQIPEFRDFREPLLTCLSRDFQNPPGDSHAQMRTMVLEYVSTKLGHLWIFMG